MAPHIADATRSHGSHTPLDYGQAFGYRFGTVEVDFQAGELHKSGLRIRVQDQPLHVLAILLRHPGQIVTREEFRALLWNADTFVDFDHGLTSAVTKLRCALDDDPEHPRFIETVPRHGYRFIAPVVKMSAAPALVRNGTLAGACGEVKDWLSAKSAEPKLAPTSDFERRSSVTQPSHFWIWSIVLSATCLLVGGLFVGIHTRARSMVSRRPVTLAVLPFRNLSPQSSRGLIAEGMTQVLITHLGDLNATEVVVSARPQVGTFDGKITNGNDAATDYVLKGGIQMQGSHLRVSVQLIRASDQSYVWTESYDDSSDDVLQAQTDIASQITAALRQKLIR